jgi:hypothetical protein
VNSYGMDPDQVQSAGRSVFNDAPEASSAVHKVLGSYLEASGVVHHPLVSAAMTAFHETHQKGHLSLPEAVKQLGSNTANGGRVIAEGSNDVVATQRSSLTSQQSLSRALNQKL